MLGVARRRNRFLYVGFTILPLTSLPLRRKSRCSRPNRRFILIFRAIGESTAPETDREVLGHTSTRKLKSRRLSTWVLVMKDSSGIRRFTITCRWTECFRSAVNVPVSCCVPAQYHWYRGGSLAKGRVGPGLSFGRDPISLVGQFSLVCPWVSEPMILSAGFFGES